MNVIDSSGWLEYFGEGKNANFFATPIQNTEKVITPTLILFEVFRRIIKQRGESAALEAIAAILHPSFNTAAIAS